MRKALLVVGLLGILLALAPSLAAHGPDRTNYQFVGMDLLNCDAAPFDGVTDYQVQGVFRGHYNAQQFDEGATLKVNYVFHGTITNLSSGQVVNDRIATSELYTFDFSNAPDQVLVTISGHGNLEHLVLRGGGPVSINAGAYTLVFDATDPNNWVFQEIVIEAGHFDLAPWSLCNVVGDGEFLEYVDGYFEVTRVMQ